MKIALSLEIAWQRVNVYQVIYGMPSSERQNAINLRDLCLCARLQVWGRGGNFVDRVDKKTLHAFPNFSVRSNILTSLLKSLLIVFLETVWTLYFATADKNFWYLFSHKYSLHIASILWETHWIYKQESLVAGIGSLVFLTV